MNWVNIGSGNGLLPARHQAITWINAGLLSMGLLGTNFSEILIIQENAIKNVIFQSGGHFVQGDELIKGIIIS